MSWTPKQTAIAAVVVVAGVWYLKSKTGAAVDSVTTAFNPTDSRNLANRGAQGIWDAFTDGQGTIGTDIYDFFNGND
jgi:hypothetical protein